jgi:hypothetical protein
LSQGIIACKSGRSAAACAPHPAVLS